LRRVFFFAAYAISAINAAEIETSHIFHAPACPVPPLAAVRRMVCRDIGICRPGGRMKSFL
jgi:hypothetical protein